MAYEFGDNLQLNHNQLLSARLELVTALPSPTKAGRFIYVSNTLNVNDGVDLNGHIGVATQEGASDPDHYRFLAGINRTEAVTGSWVFAPGGLNTNPGGILTVPQFTGINRPFEIRGQSRIPAGLMRTTDNDSSGDYTQGGGLTRYLQNHVEHLGADLLDGYHATLEVIGYGIPVRTPTGHIRVPLDPSEPTHATSRQYVDNTRGGIRVRTPVDYRTTIDIGNFTEDTTLGFGRMTQAGTPSSLSVDGFTPTVGQRIMVAEETDPTKNWVCTVHTVGAAGTPGTPWVLHRVEGSNPDPDGVGEYTYGDYFIVMAGTTHADKSYIMSGTPAEGGGVAPGSAVYFNLYQVAQPVRAGRGIVKASDAKLHFWKEAYANSELYTFPYLLANVDGTGAIGTIGMYGSGGTYTVKSPSTNRIPRRATDAGAVFADSILVEDGTDLYPNTTRGLGKSGNVWSSLWVTSTTSGGKLTHVHGLYGGTAQMVSRAWANFISDVATDISLSGYVPTSRTLQFTSPNSSVTISNTGALDLSANRSWTLDVNWGQRSLKLSSPANHLTFSLLVGGTYAASLEQTLGENREWWIKLPQDLHTAAGPTFASVTLNGTTPATSILAHVAGKVGAGHQVQFRSWNDFLADINILGTAVDRNRNITLVSSANQLTFAAIEAGVYASTLTQNLTSDKTWWIKLPQDLHTAAEPTFASVTLNGTTTTAGSVFAHVAGKVGSDNKVQFRSWANFITDITATAVPPSTRSNTLGSHGSQLTFSATEGGTYAATLTQDLSANRSWYIKLPQNLDATAGPTFASVTLNGTTAAGAQLAHVAGKTAAGAHQVQFRSWSDFITDLADDVVPNNRSITLSPGSGIAITGGTQDLSANRTWTIALSGTVASTSITMPANAVAYGNGSNQLTGNAAVLSFNGTTLAVANRVTADGATLGGGASNTHRLEFNNSTSTAAPIRFGSSNVLLTTPTAGVLETDLTGATPRARLYFTDGTPTRRGLAYTGDVNFTNDPSAEIGGGVVFQGPVSAALCSAVTTEVLGTGSWSAWIRTFVRPDATQTGGTPMIFSLYSAVSPDAVAVLAYIGDTGALRLISRQGAFGNDADIYYNGFRSTYGGKIVDFFVTKDSTGVAVYVDGVRLTRSSGSLETDVKWQRDMNVAVSFRPGSYTGVTGDTYDGTIYRAVLWNRTLTEAETLRVTREGLDPTDHWGSNTATYTSNFTSSVDGWTASNGTLASNQTVGGQAGSLRISGNTAQAYVIAYRGTLSRRRRYRMTGNYYIPAANTVCKRLQVAFHNTAATTYAYGVPSYDAWTSFVRDMDVSDPVANSSNAFFAVAMLNSAGNYTTFPAGDSMSFYNLKVFQIGALVDLNLGVGAGAAIPDRSGRYPAAITGTVQHLVPAAVGNGPGVYFGVRKHVSTLTAVDNDNKDVVHNLGTQMVSVFVWDSNDRQISVSVARKPGNENNAVTLGFGLFNAPVTAQTFTAVVIG